MWASFTSGTYQFLTQLTKKHDQFDFYFMKSNSSTVVYYEHNRKKSIFVSGKTFSILASYAQFHPKGFVTMEHVPVTDDGAKIFEERLLSVFPELKQRYGVLAMRLLKQKRKNEFVVITQWKSERNWDRWRESPMYEYQNIQQFARQSAYFAERPFTNTFVMIDEEE